MRTLLAVAALAASGCLSAEEIFTGDRLENLCVEALPVCGQRAGCVLAEDQFIEGTFPGGQRLIVRTPTERSELVVRIFLADPVDPGTELQVRAGDVGCTGFDEIQRRDVDLFELAGSSRTLTEVLEVEGRGDHLVEVFSDMASDFLLRVGVRELRGGTEDTTRP